MLVPSILTVPLMSPATFAAWADSGRITRDTLDTVFVELRDSLYYYYYAVDMKRGLVISLQVQGAGAAYQQYMYGFENGIYYLRRICFTSADTTIASLGGYDFYNIKVNGNLMTQVIAVSYDRGTRRGDRFSGGLTLLPAAERSAPYYDLLGRKVVQAFQLGAGARGVSRAGRSSGVYLQKSAAKKRKATNVR